MSSRGQIRPSSGSGEYNRIQFIVRQLLNRANTATLVKVISVTNDGSVSAAGTVDVQPLVNQIDGAGNMLPHGQLHKIPYARMQGGANAVILDPQVGDIGIAIFADHDISAVKASKAQANPGSSRRFDMADGLYIGGFLNGTPTQYVQFSGAGISIVSPNQVTVTAPNIAINGNTTITGNLTVTGDANASGTSLHTHVHGGVTPGGSDTTGPV